MLLVYVMPAFESKPAGMYPRGRLENECSAAEKESKAVYNRLKLGTGDKAGHTFSNTNTKF